METSSTRYPAIGLSALVCRQLVYTLTGLLPPPLDDTPTARRARNHAAVAKVAALLPVNPNGADLAAQWVAAWARAEEMLRLLRQHAGDIDLVMRLNAQYGSMVRTSLSEYARLMRVQAVRQKREAIDGAASADARALHAAERSMLIVVDPDAGALKAASPKAAPVATRVEAPVEAPAAYVDQRIAENVSYNGTNSHNTAFETGLSAQPYNQGARRSGKTAPREGVGEATILSRSVGRALPANGRESPGSADQGGHDDGQTASASSGYCAASL